MAHSFTDQNFEEEVLKAEGLVLVDFFAEWCGPCKMLAPVIDQLAEEHKDVKIGKLNTDENREVSGKYEVSGIPLLIFFKNGEEVARAMGFQSKEVLEEQIKELS